MRVARALFNPAALGAAALILAGTACSSEASLDGLAQGISRDSVITVLAGFGWDHMTMVAGQTKAQIPAFKADD